MSAAAGCDGGEDDEACVLESTDQRRGEQVGRREDPRPKKTKQNNKTQTGFSPHSSLHIPERVP